MIINIKANVPDRWANCFCSFLHRLQSNGNIGHSSTIGFYADGDGDFRPTFEFDVDFEKVEPDYYGEKHYELEAVYDVDKYIS